MRIRQIFRGLKLKIRQIELNAGIYYLWFILKVKNVFKKKYYKKERK